MSTSLFRFLELSLTLHIAQWHCRHRFSMVMEDSRGITMDLAGTSVHSGGFDAISVIDLALPKGWTPGDDAEFHGSLADLPCP